MAIISFCFMLMGTQSGANMFARMAHYFEIGTVCVLPWLIRKPFARDSSRLVMIIAVVCFFVFFVYAFGVVSNFDDEYRAVTFFSI